MDVCFSAIRVKKKHLSGKQEVVVFLQECVKLAAVPALNAESDAIVSQIERVREKPFA